MQSSEAPLVIFDLDPSTEIDPFRILAGSAVNHLKSFDPLGQKANPSVDLAQPFFTIDIVRVFRSITERRRNGHSLRDPRALFLPEPKKLGLKFFETCSCDVVTLSGHQTKLSYPS